MQKLTILQPVTPWNEPNQLQFKMKDTTIYFKSCVASIKEQFILKEDENQYTQIIRTADFIV